MDMYGWLQLAAFVGLLLLLTKPMGLYLFRVLDGEGRTFLDPVLKPVELLFYRIFRVDRKQEQDWKQYTISLLMFSLIGLLFTYLILRIQHLLPLNPQGFGPLSPDLAFNTAASFTTNTNWQSYGGESTLSYVSPDLAFNTAASFTTNTNWQSYGGESTLSYFSQMVGLAFHNFVSAAVGIAIAAALVRGIARHTAKTIGHFWVDLVRVNLYLLLPICLFYALFLVSQGMIQNFKAYETAKVVEPYTVQVVKKDAAGQEMKDAQGKAVMEEQKVDTQTIAQGPMASQVAIKMLGTNGGGFVNANAAHPYENPTPLSNFFQMLSIFLSPAASPTISAGW